MSLMVMMGTPVRLSDWRDFPPPARWRPLTPVGSHAGDGPDDEFVGRALSDWPNERLVDPDMTQRQFGCRAGVGLVCHPPGQPDIVIGGM
ncbi:MAG: hypothetical protein ACKN9W_06125, partial [Methylococcus sp.]